MSQKCKQKSRSKPQLEDYAFPTSPQSQLFEHYAQFRDDEPGLGRVLGHPSPSERKQPLLDKELDLELEVLHLRQVLRPATPPTTSAAPCGKSDTKKRIIDWPQDFVPGTSINPEFNSLDLPSFIAGYLVMIRTYDAASNAHMLAILEVVMAKAISYTWQAFEVSIPIWQGKSNCVDSIRIALLTFGTWRPHFTSIRNYTRPIPRI